MLFAISLQNRRHVFRVVFQTEGEELRACLKTAKKKKKNRTFFSYLPIYENNGGFEIEKTEKQFQLLFRAGFEPGSHVTHPHFHIYLSCLTSVLATSTESHSIAISKHVILSLLSTVTSAPLSNKKLSRLSQFCMHAK